MFDKTRQIGVTLSDEGAEKVAKNADHYAALPDESRQHSILTYAPSDMPRVMVRMRPFLGQLGTVPSMAMPDSHNAGDFGAFLVERRMIIASQRKNYWNIKLMVIWISML